jgi:hypothetical protein
MGSPNAYVHPYDRRHPDHAFEAGHVDFLSRELVLPERPHRAGGQGNSPSLFHEYPNIVLEERDSPKGFFGVGSGTSRRMFSQLGVARKPEDVLCSRANLVLPKERAGSG